MTYYAIGYCGDGPMQMLKARYTSIDDALEVIVECYKFVDITRTDSSARAEFQDGTYYLVFKEA